MILPFSTQFKDGIPTNFIEKIWSCIINDLKPIKSGDLDKSEGLQTIQERAKYNMNIYEASKLAPKRHSIREDVHDRWQQGRLIHPVINNRSKNQFQFAPTMSCVSTQKIEIKYTNSNSDYPRVDIDNRIFNVWNKHELEVIETLAKNDGFNSVEDFFAWFNADYSGKIIHWTDLKY